MRSLRHHLGHQRYHQRIRFYREQNGTFDFGSWVRPEQHIIGNGGIAERRVPFSPCKYDFGGATGSVVSVGSHRSRSEAYHGYTVWTRSAKTLPGATGGAVSGWAENNCYFKPGASDVLCENPADTTPTWTQQC